MLSWWLLSKEGKALTPTDPLLGMGVMAIYLIFLLTGKMKRIRLYRILMLIAVLLFGYSGIIKHVISLYPSPEIYYSWSSGIIAILINLFGLGLNLIAVWGMFRVENVQTS